MIRIIAGTLGGALLGYIYYRGIGCSSGACPLTSNPWIATIYGGVLGFMFASMLGR